MATDEGVVVAVKLSPRSTRDAVGAPRADARGTHSLHVSVTAPPTDNLANEALVAVLSKSWKVPKSAIEIVAGSRGREKKVLIRGDGGHLKALIETLIGDLND